MHTGEKHYKIEIVGTVSGAVCASTLAKNGLSVTLFESARGPGGRMSQRRHFSFFHYHLLLSFLFFSVEYFIIIFKNVK